MSERKTVYMKYLVLKMNDRLDLNKLFEETYKQGMVCPKVSDVAEALINAIVKDSD